MKKTSSERQGLFASKKEPIRVTEDAKTTQSLLWYGRLTKLASADLLSSLLALAKFMRLSLLKAAHANLFCAACSKSRVSSKR
jgi:hypothetical protein